MDCFKQDALCPFFDAIPRFKCVNVTASQLQKVLRNEC